MTLCETITKIIIRMVEEEGKNLDEIANEMCPKIEYGREKIIRIIKDFLGEEYLIQHAETLKYDVGKAQLAKKRKQRSHEKIDATTDTDVESASLTPIASCQPLNTEQVKKVEPVKEQEQALQLDKAAACCQGSSKAVRKAKKTDSENITEEKSGKLKGQEQVLEDLAPVVNVSDELVGEIKRLIEKFSLEEVKKALVVAENDICGEAID